MLFNTLSISKVTLRGIKWDNYFYKSILSNYCEEENKCKGVMRTITKRGMQKPVALAALRSVRLMSKSVHHIQRIQKI